MVTPLTRLRVKAIVQWGVLGLIVAAILAVVGSCVADALSEARQAPKAVFRAMDCFDLNGRFGKVYKVNKQFGYEVHWYTESKVTAKSFEPIAETDQRAKPTPCW